jgi:hypothetical protein
VWENEEGLPNGVPHLVYISREKQHKHPHNSKAGAMNVLVRSFLYQVWLASTKKFRVKYFISTWVCNFLFFLRVQKWSKMVSNLWENTNVVPSVRLH